MKEKPVTEAAAKRFLLGDVDDAERQRIEKLFLTDLDVKETILSAEEDLFEDYQEGSLTQSDTDKFLGQYARTPSQRRKLRIAGSIKDYSRAEWLEGQAASPVIQKPSRVVPFRWLTGRFFIPATIAVCAVLLIATVWFVQWNSRRMREVNLHLALERELIELNTASSPPENGPQTFSLVLPPVSVRSVQSRAEVSSQTGYRVIELQLLWTSKEDYQSYRAALRRAGGNEEFTIPNLRVERASAGNVVRLRLPAQTLAPGQYQVSLHGIGSDGTSGLTEEYDFLIGR